MIKSLCNSNYSLLKSQNSSSEEDNLVYSLLYFSYVLFFGILFLTNNFFLPYEIFLFFVIPLSIVPVYIVTYKNVADARRFKFELSFINPRKTLSVVKSNIFVSVCIYVTIISLSTWLYPSPSLVWFLVFFKYSISILFFLGITSRLINHSKREMEIFCAILCLIVAINAAINIYLYVMSLPNIYYLNQVRFTPSFGRAPDRYPTTCALTYAIFFGIATCLAIQIKSIIMRIVSSICASILLSGIVITQSRGPLIASMLSLIIISFFSLPKLRNIMITTIGFLVFGFLLLPGIGTWAIQRGENGRFEVWSKFTSLTFSRPILGYGERIEFHIELINGNIIGHAHNIYMSALIRGGIIACLSLIAIIGLGIKHSTDYIKKTSNFIPLCATLILAIAGLVDFDLIIFLTDWQWGSLWLVIGIAISTEMNFRE